MNKFQTEFSEVFNETIDDEFKPSPEIPDGQGLWVQINSGIITPDFLSWYKKSLTGIQEVENTQPTKTKKSKPDTKEMLSQSIQTVEVLEEQMQTQARLLGGAPGTNDPDNRVVRDWGLVKKGKPVEVSNEAMLGLGFKTLNALFNWCMYSAGAPKKTNDKQSDNT